MEVATRVHLCGRLRIDVAGEPREELLRGRQGRLLFAFLVLRRHGPVTRDALVEAVWGEDGLPPSEGALAPVLSRLRRAVAPAKLEGRESVVLSLPEPAWVDVEAAEAALRSARGSTEAATRLAGAQEAAAVAGSGLLPGLEAPWLSDERIALDRLRIEALELGADAARTIEPPLAETLARAAIAGAPFRESAWLALIGALQAQGNVAQALQAYEDVRRMLRDELGAVPGRELVALHSRLLAESDDAPRTIRGAAKAAPPRPGGAQPTGDLVEREDELHAIDSTLDRLAAGQGGIVLFEGPAGIGKTRLLDELGHRAATRDLLVVRPAPACSSASSPSGSSASCLNQWRSRA